MAEAPIPDRQAARDGSAQPVSGRNSDAEGDRATGSEDDGRTPSPIRNQPQYREFAIRLGLVVLAVAATLLLHQLAYLLLLIFAAALLAIAAHALADLLEDRLGLTKGIALLTVGAFGALLPLAIGLAAGNEIGTQLEVAARRIPTSAAELSALLERAQIPPQLIERLVELNFVEALARLAGSLLSDASAFGAAAVLVIVIGIYLAVQPATYLDGLSVLFPKRHRSALRDLGAEISIELKLWWKAQLCLMVMVGTLTGLGAWILGIPAPIALGFAAGMLEIVPYLGPILAAIPALALGLSVGVETAALMLVWIVVVQQLEGLVLTPMVLRRAVRLPPAVSLVALIAAGMLFGAAGVLLAAPGAVVIYVFYRRVRTRRLAAPSDR